MATKKAAEQYKCSGTDKALGLWDYKRPSPGNGWAPIIDKAKGCQAHAYFTCVGCGKAFCAQHVAVHDAWREVLDNEARERAVRANERAERCRVRDEQARRQAARV